MRGVAGRAVRLLRGCWKTMLLFEIVFRLFSMFAVFPACKWLFNAALRATGLNYFSPDNLGRVLTNPLMLGCFALLFLAFSLTSMLEAACLITCLDAGSERNVLRMIREGLRDALRLLRPRNLPMLLVTAFLIPVTYLPSSASPLKLIDVPWRTLWEQLTRFPLALAPLTYLALVALLTALAMCAYQRYVLEDASAAEAIRGALRLNRGRRLRSLGGFSLWTLLAAGGSLALVYALGLGLNRLIPLLLPDAGLQYRALAFVSISTNFLRSATPAIACTSFLNAAYAERMEALGEARPPRRLSPGRDARRFNALLFYFVLILCVMGTLVYDTHIRPLLVRMNALEYVSGHPTRIVAHRGYFADGDENTLSAFRAAIALGVDYVELDVQLTADGEVIVNHDASYGRVYGVNRRVWELTLAQTRQLRSKVSGECPPTLREVLNECDPQANFLIELKDNGHDPELARAVYGLLTELDCLDRCSVQSSTYRMIREFKALSPDTRCGYILSFALGSYASLDAADFFSLDYNFANARVMDAIHSAGKDLYVWTINDESRISAAVALGADGVITDDTPLAKTLLLEQEAAAPLDELLVAPIEEALQEAEEAPGE